MGLTSKKSKIIEVDRISNLPDSLQLKILSFLPIKSAACTSLLSKRWRPLCMSLTNLEFDDNYIEKHGRYLTRKRKESRMHFRRFVDRLLMHRANDLKIEKFGLSCVKCYHEHCVNNWIRSAIAHDLKELRLRFGFRELHELIQEVYTCTSLEILRLSCSILVNIPEDVKFSRLRVLNFIQVTISSFESVGRLLLNCPVLEEVSISECNWLSGHCLSICGSSLKKFSLLDDSPVDKEFFLEILIDTPALETLEIQSYASNVILIRENLQFLRTAFIDIEQILQGVVANNLFGDSVFGLLNKINQVNSLFLGGKTVEVLNSAYKNESTTILHRGFPPFHNLTELILDVEAYCGENVLDDFLLNSPNLQCLDFPRGLIDPSFDESWRFSWGWPSSCPECLSKNLKTVYIREFYGMNEELSLVEYLLMDGSALEKVSISSTNLWDGAEVKEELLTYHKESATCKLVIEF